MKHLGKEISEYSTQELERHIKFLSSIDCFATGTLEDVKFHVFSGVIKAMKKELRKRSD